MPPLLFEYKVGTGKPDVTGFFPTVDLTSATIVVDIKNLGDGTVPFTGSQLNAVFVSKDASGSRVKWVVPAAWLSAQKGDYVGWFKATIASTVYVSPGFYLKVLDVDHTPSAYPFQYGDGRGGYASVTDVVQLMRNRDGISSKTDDAFIETMLGDTAMELDSALENIYNVPITKAMPKAWAYLRRIHKMWALAEWHDTLIANDPKHADAAMNWKEKGSQLLENLFDGSVILRDANGAVDRPDYPQSDGMAISDALDPAIDDANVPIFSVNNMNRNGRLI